MDKIRIETEFDNAVFDLDGTLLDSMYVWEELPSRYIKSVGKIPEEGLAAKVMTFTVDKTAEYFISTYNLDKTVKEIVQGINDMVFHFYSDEVQLKPGVKSFLEELNSRGIKMCIATATDTASVKAALNRLGIFSFFKGIVSTCDCVQGKEESSEVYDKSVLLLDGTKESTVIFEDAIHAVRTAKKAGYKICGIYDKAESHKDEMQTLCDWYVQEWSQLSQGEI